MYVSHPRVLSRVPYELQTAFVVSVGPLMKKKFFMNH
jgi:hypothetical protein